MNNKIDIVITYVDDTNSVWKDKFNYWKEYEIRNGIISKDSRQAFGCERTRNWKFLKYWFRAVEKNCPWVNKVFFVVQNENHIPKWLNTDYDKLRIVYHNEFIPKELLPTFNSFTIELFVSNIEDLNDNYISCNDDFFFINRIEENRFFKNNVAQHEDNRVPFGHYFDGDEYLHIMNNSTDFEERYMDKNDKVKYHFYHLPSAHKKNFEQELLRDNYDYLMSCQKPSKFRYKTNVDPNILTNCLKLENNSKRCYIGKKGHVYNNCGYVVLKSGVNFENFKDRDIICFNDTNLADVGFHKIRDDLNNFLESMFPEKSGFEKEVCDE